ncbi:MAG: hypothetical protein AAF492_05775, partial [Verrucomicrobiota bacterium]
MTETNIFLAALIFALRVGLIGAGWCWILRKEDPDRLYTWLTTWCLGLIGSALIACTLGFAGHYRPGIEWTCIGVLSVTGFVLGRIRGQRIDFAERLSGAALFFGIVLIALLLPQRGEWIAGGWDPGVYINQGVAFERNGAFDIPDDFFEHPDFEKSQMLFSDVVNKRWERYPGFIANNHVDGLRFEFFRLTPSMNAVLVRSGGLRLLHRGNTIFAILTVMALVVWLRESGRHPWAWLAGVFLVFQPIWLYHSHTPTTEMLQLLILLFFAI